ncbi:MAG: hypothetical protein WBZ33_08010 [Thermoactinomyces sp.]
MAAENTSDSNISFNGIDTITTNTGQQIEVAQTDFIVDDDMQIADYLGKVKKEGIIGVPVKNADQINHINLFLSDVYDSQKVDPISKSQKVGYDL